MRPPKKREILERARELAAERQMRQGLPIITPTERELKETGDFERARRDLMTTHGDIDAQQQGYIHGMADELGLKLIEKAELKALERRQATLTRREKEIQQQQYRHRRAAWVGRGLLHMLRKGQGFSIAGVSIRPLSDQFKGWFGPPKAEPVKVTRAKGPIPVVDLRKRSRKRSVKKLPTMQQAVKKITKKTSTPLAKPVKKRKKSHTERSGKTMRALKDVNGVNVFSFPDHIWGTKKPRKQRKKRKKKR